MIFNMDDTVDSVQEQISSFLMLADNGKPHKSRLFRRLIPFADPEHPEHNRTGKVFERLGETSMVDLGLIYHMTETGRPMTIKEIGDEYRSYCRQDDEDPDGVEHADATTNWHVYEVLCLLVGAGFGVWMTDDNGGGS